MGELKTTYKIVVGKPLTRSMHILEDSMKICVTKVASLYECLDWIHLGMDQ